LEALLPPKICYARLVRDGGFSWSASAGVGFQKDSLRSLFPRAPLLSRSRLSARVPLLLTLTQWRGWRWAVLQILRGVVWLPRLAIFGNVGSADHCCQRERVSATYGGTRTSRGRLRELIPRFTRAPSLPLANSAAQVPGVLKLLFPNAISPKDSTEKLNVFRLRTCLDHVKEGN